jgi:hypothetical protein
MDILHSSFGEVIKTSHRPLSLLNTQVGSGVSADVPITMGSFAHVFFFHLVLDVHDVSAHPSDHPSISRHLKTLFSGK